MKGKKKVVSVIPSNLPRCWLGKSITVTGENGSMVGVIVRKSMINPACTCKKERDAYFCECGGKLKVCNKTKSKLKGGGQA